MQTSVFAGGVVCNEFYPARNVFGQQICRRLNGSIGLAQCSAVLAPCLVFVCFYQLV